MKKIIILNIVLLLVACNKQTEIKKENSIKKYTITEIVTIIKKGKKTMEKFDVEKYIKNREDGKTDADGELIFTLENGTKIIQGGDGETVEKLNRTYYEKIKKKNDPIILEKYYSHTGTLVLKGEIFHDNGFFKGIWCEYNEQGTLVKEIDYDAPYKDFIPWDKVKEYCENRGIDLMAERSVVYRSPNGWFIEYRLNEIEKFHDKIYDSNTIANIDLNSKGQVMREYLTFYEESSFTHLMKDELGDDMKGLIIINNPQNKEQSILEIEEKSSKQTENIIIAIIVGVTVLMVSIILYFKFLKK